MIRLVVPHDNPHGDELAAWDMMLREGREKLNISPDVQLLTISQTTKQDWGLDRLRKHPEVLLLGLGGNREPGDKAIIIDEHGLPEEQKRNECAFTLVAKRLGLRDSPRWKPIIDAVLSNDRTGAQSSLNINPMVRLGQTEQDWSLQEAIAYMEKHINMLLRRQDAYLSANWEDVRQVPIRINGQNAHMAIIAKGDRKALTRRTWSNRLPIAIVKNEDGHVQILVNQNWKGRIDMTNVFTFIRAAEFAAQGDRRWLNILRLPRTATTIRQLEPLRLAILPGSPWFPNHEMNSLLNGGESRLDITPTKLGLSTIVQIVQLALASV